MKPLGVEIERERPWERWLLAAVVIGFALLAFAEVAHWRPGFARTDETELVSYEQMGREGTPWEYEVFKGCIFRRLLSVILSLTGPSMLALHFLTWGAMLLEAWLLLRLGRALLSRRAALWALLAGLACATTFLRSRSLLAYAILPAELLLALAFIARRWGALGSLAYGAFAAFMLSDYEGWVFALPMLLIFWLREEPQNRPQASWALLGFGAVLASLLVPSWGIFQEHLLQRARNVPGVERSLAQGAGQALRGFFIGIDQVTGHMGVKMHPVMAFWAMPALLWGAFILRKHGKILWLWALFGLLPIFSTGGAGEPNRVMAAWPALCLIAGQGMLPLLRACGKRDWIFAFLLLGLGLAWEGRSYLQSMRSVEGSEYAPSQAVLELARQWPHAQPLMDFDYKGSAHWRYVWQSQALAPRQGEIFVLRWEYFPALKGQGAALNERPISDSSPPWIWFSQGPPAFQRRLLACDAALRGLHQSLPRFDKRGRREALRHFMAAGPDPIAFTAALEEAVKISTELGEIPPDLLAAVMRGPLVCASSALWLADMAASAGDSRSAGILCARARRIDGRCDCKY